MLLLLVVAYVAIVVASLWATVASFLRPRSWWGRHPVWVAVVMAAEVVYMLQAPACVYLPRAPGKPAVQRHLLGADPAGHLYWLESTAPVAFLWGPRWWISFRPDISPVPLPYGGGINWVAPLRYAAWKAARWELVSDDGRRWAIPDWQGSAGTMESGDPRTLGPDGTLLTLEPTGIGRFASVGGLRAFKPGSANWSCAPPCGLPGLGFAQGLASTADGVIWEIIEPGNAGQVADRQDRGERLLLFRVRSGGADLAPRVFELSFRQKPGRAGPSGAHGIDRSSLALFLSTWDGEGTVYKITEGTPPQVQELSPFVFDHYKAPDPWTKGVPFAMTADATLFTTGQAIWDVNGVLLADIDPPLESAVWVGHTLHGVRAYPFFGHRYLRRHDDRSSILSQAASGLFRDDDRDARQAAEGLRRSAWVLGGIDESGREDEIVRLSAEGDQQ